jgi:DNA helicase-2/ATP-dependent DNA helicase PcrA
MADEIRAGRRRARDFAVFYRVNALSLDFERALRQQGVPYQMVRGLEFFQRKEIKDVLSYLQLLANPHNDVALLRVINTPRRGIGKATVERLADHATRHGLTLLDAARQCRRIEPLGSRAAQKVLKFVELLDRLAEVTAGPMEELLGHVLNESGYKKQLEQSEAEEDLQRLANIEQLLSVGRDFDEQNPGTGHLEEFLEETSLVNDTDDWESENDRATLMTLHGSKGLEFPVVFMVAVEQGLLPHERSMDHPDQLEEERRLMFVGITRARQELQISLAHNRDFRGRRRTAIPSPFLMELPRDKMDLQNMEIPAIRRVAHEESLRRPATRPASGSTAAAGLTTAAELAGGGQPPAVSPEEFHQDMLVRHPQYGLGRVIALSGSGSDRKATVEFPSAGRKRFVLGMSPLRPVIR